MPHSTAYLDPLRPEIAASPLRVRRPLLGVLVAVLAGLVASEILPLPAWAWMGAAWLILVLAAIPPLRSWRTALLYSLFVLVAAAQTAGHRAPVAPDHIANRMQRPIEHLNVTGVVADDPIREAGWRPGVALWKFPLALDRIQREREWQPAQGRIEVRLELPEDAVGARYGEHWRFEGAVRKAPGRFAAPPRFTLAVNEKAAKRLAGTGGWWLRRWCLAGRRAAAERLGAGVEFDPAAVGLTRALMLGYRQELPERALSAFSRTGTMHIVAISGAHVGMIALLLLALVRATGLSQPRWPWVMAPLLLIYALSTGMAPSAIRACLMAVCFFFAYACWRQPDALSALALSALLILGADPSQLARPGFLLSYGVVAGLLILFPPVRAALHRWFVPPDPPATWLRQHLIEPVRPMLLDLFGVTLVAWLISTPLIALFFNLVSPVALVANLAVVPLAFLILFASCLALALGFIHPVLLESFNHAARFFSQCLFGIIDACDRIPASSFHVPTPSPWLVAALTLLIAAAVVGHRLVRRLSAGALLVLLLVIAWRIGPGRPLEIAVRNLGPTAVAILHVPGSGDWLIDTGPTFTERRLQRFLNESGVNRLRGIAITRASSEAAGALPAVLDRLSVEEVWIPDSRIRSSSFAALIAAVEASGALVRRRGRGDRVEEGGSAFEVLSPDRGQNYPDSGAGGLVLRVSRWASAALVFPLRDSRLERALLAHAQDYGGQAAIELNAPRDRTPASAEWQFAFRPDVIVRSVGEGGRFRPDDELDAQPGLLRLYSDETAILRAAPHSGFVAVPPPSRDAWE
ncbi:MAG: ComEC/Rec2 family competence protein [Verrucomicrobia bacterium]|nr:ComEC/Rec2 family competence protein [Verrucomicrobiota bacterium]